MSVIPPEPLSRPQIAVSAAIFRDGKILLVRRARSPAKGFYSLPGGRVEFGETLHAALHREVDEETSLQIQIVDLAEMPGLVDMGNLRPKEQWWLGLRPIVQLLAQSGVE